MLREAISPAEDYAMELNATSGVNGLGRAAHLVRPVNAMDWVDQIGPVH